jgi:hypothetical protein
MTMWITCAKQRIACVCRGERLGIVLPGGAQNGVFTWEITIQSLCIKEKAVIVHTPHRDG